MLFASTLFEILQKKSKRVRKNYREKHLIRGYPLFGIVFGYRRFEQIF